MVILNYFFYFTKKLKIYILAIIFLINLTSCTLLNDDIKNVTKQGFYFDTIIQITLYNTNNESYIDECFSMAKKYENMFSNTIADSDVSKINSSAGSDWVTVSDETIELIKKGIYYGKLSNGKFDITIGKLSELWNFSEIAKSLETADNTADESVLPEPSTVQALLSHVNYQNIQISGNDVYLSDKDAKLDLGAIAKGYIADKMKQYLNSQDITSGIINLGGNVLTIGKKNDKSDYSIGIQKPFDKSGSAMCKLMVSDCSVVTSGVYERYYRVNNTLYHHILDTSTGYPVKSDIYSVTIISESSCDGDALSTTCFSLGIEKATELIASLNNTEAVFITSDFEIVKTSDNISLSVIQ